MDVENHSNGDMADAGIPDPGEDCLSRGGGWLEKREELL
jgi:hypothetical protein